MERNMTMLACSSLMVLGLIPLSSWSGFHNEKIEVSDSFLGNAAKDSYHEGLQKWVEIGNSGMFRPEMLLPMGLPEDVQVITWGLSLERPTMILYGIDNIRYLFGHKLAGTIKNQYNQSQYDEVRSE